MVADGAQRCDDRRDVRLAKADRAAIGVGEVNVPHEVAGLAQRRRRVGLLDIHVEQISQHADVGDALRPQPDSGVADAVKKIGLVTIERLVEQRDAVRRRLRAEIRECL